MVLLRRNSLPPFISSCVLIQVGADADLVLWDEVDDRLQANKTWVAGECVFDAESQPSVVGER